MSSRRVIVFGSGPAAELAHFYLTHDSPYEVAGFTVDAAYLQSSQFCGLPVVAFEEIASCFPAASYSMLIALGYSRINELRAAKFNEAKQRGYTLISYLSSRARTWPSLQYGENCFILEEAIIQPFVKIGNNVTLWSGCHIGHHTTIDDHCFIAPRAAISGYVSLSEKCFIGINATIRDRVKLGPKTAVGAGALILADTAEGEVHKGHAAEVLPFSSSRLREL